MQNQFFLAHQLLHCPEVHYWMIYLKAFKVILLLFENYEITVNYEFSK